MLPNHEDEESDGKLPEYQALLSHLHHQRGTGRVQQRCRMTAAENYFFATDYQELTERALRGAESAARRCMRSSALYVTTGGERPQCDRGPIASDAAKSWS